ncbi:MAG: helix-turn-helix domain-containing protein [Anaerolineales bacterium]|nr:helix-turn-helix domain-containing protein [Anaerolineales bacterium]
MKAPMMTETFGESLKYLRRRARLTQRELALAVGYSEAQICRLEKNERLPDVTTVAALFIPALTLENNPAHLEHLLKQAAQAHDTRHPASITINQVTIQHEIEQELGLLEDIPAPLASHIPRPAWTQRIQTALAQDRGVMVCGLPGVGKTVLAATAARHFSPERVFWLTLIAGVNTNVEALVRQLALFFLLHGVTQVKPLVVPRTDAKPMPLDQQVMLIRAALTHHPALLCFDDVHLLGEDEACLSFLRHLSSIPTAHLLLISRKALALPIPQLHLSGLEPTEASELALSLGLNPTDKLTHHLLTKISGNPMLLRLAAGQLRNPQLTPDVFVHHLEAHPQVTSYLINTVLRDLPPVTHWLASFIAVFRHPVNLYEPTLLKLLEDEIPTSNLHEALGDLQSRYLVDNPYNATLHPLIRDHLYTSLGLNATQKRHNHALAAIWTTQTTRDTVEVAHHWLHANKLAQTAELISAQSENLFNQGKAFAAVQVVDEALQQLQNRHSNPTRLRWLLLTARGDLLRGTLRTAEAETSYREALALAQDFPSGRAQVTRSLAQNLMQRGQATEALALCQTAAAALPPEDIILRARLAAIECRTYLLLSQYETAEKTAQYALHLIEPFADQLSQITDDVIARAERVLGWVNYTRHPQGDESLTHYQRALLSARRGKLRTHENAILSNMATAFMEREAWAEAEQVYQEALQGNEALGDLYAKAAVLHNLGVLGVHRKTIEEGLKYFEQASELERLVGDVEGLLSTEAARASTMLMLGKVPEAREVLEQALAIETHSSDVWTLGTLLCLSVEVYLLENQPETARTMLTRVLALPGLRENARMYTWATSGQALVHLIAGEKESAEEILANTPPEDVGFDLTYRWKQVQCLATLARGETAAAQKQVEATDQWAEQKGYPYKNHLADKLLETPELSLTEAFALIIVGD